MTKDVIHDALSYNELECGVSHPENLFWLGCTCNSKEWIEISKYEYKLQVLDAFTGTLDNRFGELARCLL
jgi:hypothetical protein